VGRPLPTAALGGLECCHASIQPQLDFSRTAFDTRTVFDNRTPFDIRSRAPKARHEDIDNIAE
jgi:hypothetical protein